MHWTPMRLLPQHMSADMEDMKKTVCGLANAVDAIQKNTQRNPSSDETSWAWWATARTEWPETEK